MLSDRDSISEVEKARRGDRRAFDGLVRSYSGFAFALAICTLGDEEEAMDAVQDAFVKAWTGIRKLRDPASFPSWLASIVRRASVDRTRRRPYEIQAGERVEDLPDSRRPPPSADGGGLLECAMASLRERDRALLSLVYLGELSHAEAGGILGLPEASVRVHLLRARRRLRSILEGREDELLQQVR